MSRTAAIESWAAPASAIGAALVLQARTVAADGVPVGELSRRAAVHALNRLGFGPRPGDIDRVLARGVEPWIDDQLNPGPDGMDFRLAGFRTLGYTTAQVVAAYNADNGSLGPIQREYDTAVFIRAVHSDNQLQEALAHFWFNHFNVYRRDGFVRLSQMAYDRDAIRPNVLGTFAGLLRATAHHPAMMDYLDNAENRAPVVVNGVLRAGINENYARELMELHTVGVDAGYDQDHVYELARALTGWGIDNRGGNGGFLFRANQHDRGAKRLFDLDLPANAAGDDGKSDGDKAIATYSVHPKTAQFISYKLAVRFVSDDPSPDLVAKGASTFLDTGGSIRDVVRTLVASKEFWAEAFSPTKYSTPYEFTIRSLRAVNATVTDSRDLNARLVSMGMELFNCIPPTGWEDRGADWLNASSHLQRMNFALALTTDPMGGVSIDLRPLVEGVDATNPAAVAGSVNRHIFGGRLSQASLEAASRIAPRGGAPVVNRVMGVLLAGPDFQVR